MREPSGLQRGLHSRHVSLIALGGIIGSSYFLGTGFVFHELGPSVFLAYIFGAIITFLTMACLAELTLAAPHSGSFLYYISKFISPSLGCGIGWAYWISWVVFLPSECLAAGLIIHNFTPHISIHTWTIAFGIAITLINFFPVKFFGESEFYLAIVKIAALAMFSILAVLIFFGFQGRHHDQFLGTEYLLGQGGLFPNGGWIFLFNMVILLSNFQGSEIIGLTAAESVDSKKTVANSLKNIVIRLIAIYLIPTFLLALIFPWKNSTLAGSVFSSALFANGFGGFAKVFNFLIIAGALSCANSGLYATIRALYALSRGGHAPISLSKVNSSGVPVRATIATMAVMWILIFFTLFVPAHKLYTNLLALSGLTCTFCWMAICWAQIRLRKDKSIPKPPFQVPFFPWTPLIAIFLQAICLAVIAWNPELKITFYLGLPCLLVPILIYKFFYEKRK